MDKPRKVEITDGGLYVRGVVVSSRASAFERKDGTGLVVRVEHEIATRPGVVAYQQYLDPLKDKGVKVEGGEVITFPQLPELQEVTFRIERYRVERDRLVITSAKQVP